ncbi:helix-turn-helix domain-containing protein [Bernardetia sp. OM2101]|uniref:helix-turn-helix domain-containing protein n=1 Tax=Bernardetia sp. OM2101 TaxID=3344876 RepID=UPI0035CEED16
MIDNNEIGYRITALRKAADFSMEKIANLCGVTSSAVSNYEKGRVPSLEFMYKFSDLFNISVDDFISEKFETETNVAKIASIVNKYGSYTKSNPVNSNHNIISKSKDVKNNIQSQGGVTTTNAQETDSNLVESLKKENEFLKKQLEFTQGLLEKAMGR